MTSKEDPAHEPLVALVDDDKVFQLIATKSIAATHLTNHVLQFGNGLEAIEYIQAHLSDDQSLPDVIFLDINMPIIDGWMFMEDYINLKQRIRKPIHIYMVSSSIDPRDIDRARSMPDIQEYVIKPISQDKFYDLISKAS
jgi:CheY-like chemotaxis protein